MQNHEVKFVDSKHYRGDCRRHHRRYSVVLPATLVYNENEGVVKVLDISMGGCKMVANSHCSPHAKISMTFYIPSEANAEELVACSPIHALVVRSHHTSTDHYIINVDFRGALFYEHGVDKLIEIYKHLTNH